MKLIIAGSRTWWPTDEAIAVAVERVSPWRITEVVCGMAPGADMAGHAWAKKHGYQVKEMPANWEKLGKIAGKLRNQEMALYGDRALVFWDGDSNGSTNMHAWMGALNKPSHIFTKESIRVAMGNDQAVVHAGQNQRGMGYSWTGAPTLIN